MAEDYIPKPEGDLKTWCANYKAKIAAHGAALGQDSTTIGEQEDACEAIIDDIDLTAQKKNDYHEQVATKNITKAAKIELLRTRIQQMKKHDDYDIDRGEDLDIIGEDTVVDPTGMQPEISALVQANGVIIKWKKGVLADAISIYVNRGSGYVFLATDTEPNYFDTFALPSTAQTWEYKAVYILDEDQTGLFSDEVAVQVQAAV